MRLWPVFEVHQENLLTFDLLGWKKFLEFVFRCRHWLGFYIFLSENCQNFSQILPGWANNIFKCLYHISPHERMEVIDSVIFSQLIMNFKTRLEQILKQLKLFRLPVERGHRCRKWLWHYGNSVDFIMKIRRIVAVFQLRKRQQNLTCFDRRRGVLAAELRLTGRTVFLLLSWRCTRGAVCDFFVNSCHVVLAQTLSELLSTCRGVL